MPTFTKKADDVQGQAATTASKVQTADAQRSCFANQRTIEGAAQAYNAVNGRMPTAVADLMGSYLSTAGGRSGPQCPTTHQPYVLGADGVVAPCSVHGHY